jgi:hypothetical protein
VRVSVRLDRETAAQLLFLMQATGQSASDVLRKSITQCHLHLQPKRRPSSRFLALVGTANSGRTDLSSNVKAHVEAFLESKHRLPSSDASLRLQIEPVRPSRIRKSTP